MGVLRNLEAKIAGAVEGSFSRVFRSEVRPIEIARRLAREMEENQSQSLSHVYVPNEYRVFLSPDDRRRFREYEDVLAGELGAYLLEHARREGFTLASAPVIEFESDPRLGLGQFGIRAELSELHAARRRDEGGPRSAAREQFGRTMVGSSAARIVEPLAQASPEPAPRASLRCGAEQVTVAEQGVTIGRSRRCDLVIDDANVSRRHAQISPRGSGWVLSDLGSTNGTRLNGTRLQEPEMLRDGDQIDVGGSPIEFTLR